MTGFNYPDFLIQIDGIIKSKNDNRNYSSFKLDNSLRVVLVNDPTLKISSASLCVGVGSIDEGNTMGLAHFLEHLLFLGSVKYPESNAYNAALAKYSGRSNAFTSATHTCYFYTVPTDAFEEVLDIFGQFFISPLFTEQYVMKEMNAVNSEHNNNILHDAWRKMQIMHTICKDNHPFNHFGTGNLETLDIPNIVNIVKEFYNKNYSADNMVLTLVSNLKLNDMERMVKEIFSVIPNKNTLGDSRIKIRNYDLPYNVPQTAYITPIKSKNKICLTWQMKIDQNMNKLCRKYKILNFISHFIGHEGYGSIYELLRRKNYVLSLSAGTEEHIGDIMTFGVNIETTELGFEHIDVIIDVVYSYINKLLKSSKAEIHELYKESQMINNQELLYIEKYDAESYAIQISKLYVTEDIDSEKVLIDNIIMDDYDDNVYTLMMHFLSLMNKNNAITLITTQDDRYSKFKNKTEPYYGIEYGLNSTDVQTNTNLDYDRSELYLPNLNRFICTNLDVLKDPIFNEFPMKIKHNNNELWYQYTDKYNVPHVRIITDIIVPDVKNTVIKHIQFLLFVYCVNDEINPDLYECNMSNYQAHISPIYSGINISIYGPSAGIYKVFDMCIKKILYPDISINTFERQLAKFKKDLKNSLYEPPYATVHRLLQNSIEKYSYSIKEMTDNIDAIEYSQIKSYSKFNKDSCIRTYIVGNIKENNVILLSDLLNQFNPSKVPINIEKIIIPNVHSNKVIKETSHNPNEKNSATSIYIDIGYTRIDTKNQLEICKITSLCSVIELLIKDLFFDQLRTDEQLGYYVSCNKLSLGNPNCKYLMFKFIVQSNVKNSDYLAERIKKFINDVRDYICNVTKEELAERCDSLIKNILKPDDNLHDFSSSNYRKIVSTDNVLNIDDILVEVLKNINLQDVINFYDKYFYLDDTRKMCCVQIN